MGKQMISKKLPKRSTRLAPYILAGTMVAICSLFTNAYPVRPVSAIDTQTLFRKSDLVCTGTVTRVSLEQESPSKIGGMVDRKILAEIRPTRIYKGSAAEIVQVSYQISISRGAETPVPSVWGKDSYQLLFLVKTGNSYSFVDDEFGHFNVSPLLASAVGDGMTQLEADLRMGLHDQDKSKVLSNLMAGGTDKPLR